MKVLLINGSPNEKGCTYTALAEVEGALNRNGIETELLWLGKKPIAGCMACGKCHETGRCVWNDLVCEITDRVDEFDGIVVGSPVYYAAASGQITSFLNRLFFSSPFGAWQNKPGCAIVSCRRGGASSAFEQLNKYFGICNMPTVGSQYWNQVHGTCPEEVRQDLEGMQTMRTLGNNMAWLLKCIEAGKSAGVPLPEREAPAMTNFIR